MKPLLPLLSVFFLFSCSNGTLEAVHQNPQQDEINYASVVAHHISEITSGDEIYESVNSTIWFDDSLNSESAVEILEILDNSLAFGLPNEHNVDHLKSELSAIDSMILNEEKIEAICEFDLRLTNTVRSFASHLKNGIELSQVSDSLADSIDQLLISAHMNGDIIGGVLGCQPSHPEYKMLQKGAAQFVQSFSLSGKRVEVINYSIDSSASYTAAKEALVNYGYIEADVNDSVFMNALLTFQMNHGLSPDGVIGKQTAEALSQSAMEDYLKIAHAMEQWKKEGQWDNYHAFVNIPGYTVKYFSEGSVINEHKVVVGTPWTRTPTFDSEIERITAFPYWNVPKSIKIGELVPKAKKDSMYLANNNYEVLAGRKVIKSNTIDWNSAAASDYLIRQKGGSRNALGLVKFYFENPYSVYMHDTPSKKFFAKDIRAYSHGCIRVDQPIAMAEFLLDQDGKKKGKEQLNKSIKDKSRKVINLKSKVPLHVRYLLAEANENGEVKILKDVYSKCAEDLDTFKSYFEGVSNASTSIDL